MPISLTAYVPMAYILMKVLDICFCDEKCLTLKIFAIHFGPHVIQRQMCLNRLHSFLGNWLKIKVFCIVWKEEFKFQFAKIWMNDRVQAAKILCGIKIKFVTVSYFIMNIAWKWICLKRIWLFAPKLANVEDNISLTSSTKRIIIHF